jgi:hypothetical protein
MFNIHEHSHSAQADYNGALELYDPGRCWFLSHRRCPVCGPKQRLLTNGSGDFKCGTCDRRDHQDVQRYIDAGLDYVVPVHDRNAARVMGDY